jgi:hypothetical protein
MAAMRSELTPPAAIAAEEADELSKWADVFLPFPPFDVAAAAADAEDTALELETQRVLGNETTISIGISFALRRRSAALASCWSNLNCAPQRRRVDCEDIPGLACELDARQENRVLEIAVQMIRWRV